MPGQGTQLRLSLLCWKERRSHSEHGANPVEEDEPAGQGAGVKIKQITVRRTVKKVARYSQRLISAKH